MKEKIKLEENWLIQSSEDISVFGEEISSLAYQPTDWIHVKVPTTVVNGLYQTDQIEKEPYYGTNLRELRGYKIDVKRQNLESHYKPKDSPYRASWWFRTTFNLPEEPEENTEEAHPTQYWLLFKGIHYRSNIWLNGKRIAGSDFIIGTYRRYFLNITEFITLKEPNVLAVEVFSSEPDELGISFVDWCPLPPDDDMGIWQPVYLFKTGPVVIKNLHVQTALSSDLHEARINIEMTVENVTKQLISVTIQGEIEDIQLSKKVQLESYEKKEVKFQPQEYHGLILKNPRIWWPYQLGTPELYELKLTCLEKEYGLTDEHYINFGVREFSSRINEYGSMVYSINGQEILVRGAGWTCDMMLRHPLEEDKAHIALLKNLNFNTVRLEGKLATDEFWDLCDREGILVMAGWCCCSHWEKWSKWKAGDIVVAVESLRSQLLRLRNHPSFLVWLYGSDFPPPKPVEAKYLELLEELTPELPVLSSASHYPSDLRGKTGVKMTGPYTYVPPIYWYSDGRIGEAKGFNTETGPDVCIPPLESLQRMMPADQLRLDSEAWSFHAGLGAFKDTALIEQAVKDRYGSFQNLPEFVELSQILGYEAWRSMFEAYGRNFPEGTGVIGWMLNSPWPSLIWQLYDFYFNPNGAYYGSKKACEPIHIQYSYDDHSIWITNFTQQEISSMTATIRVFNAESQLLAEKQLDNLSLGVYAYKPILILEELVDLKMLPAMFFLDLSLQLPSATKSIQSIYKNFYWLPKESDELAEKDDWPYTPVTQAADLSQIRNLPRTSLQKEVTIEETKDSYHIWINLENNSDTIAFFVWGKIKDTDTQKYVSPVYWNDNCISLMPKETYTLIAEVNHAQLKGKPEVSITGFNIA